MLHQLKEYCDTSKLLATTGRGKERASRAGITETITSNPGVGRGLVGALGLDR